MPGLNFVCGLRGQLRENDAAILNALDALLHFDFYSRKVLVQNNFYFLANTGYETYPLETFHIGDVSIYLEGYLYGTDNAARQAKLSELVEFAFDASSSARERITEWVTTRDGEFVLFLFHDKSGEVVVLNDFASQLPLYLNRTADTLIISRDLRFIAKQQNPVRFDRMALAQYLLFGFPLGARTLLDNVGRVAPASWIRINPLHSVIGVERLAELNVEATERAETTIQENAVVLAELLTAACRARFIPGMNYVLSLSGGMDARCVAAGLHRAGIPFHSATFRDHVGNAAHDGSIAQRVAEFFDSDWQLLELGAPTRQAVLTLLRIKNGMNPLGMAFLLPFLETIRNSLECPVFFMTGVGGLATLYDPRSALPLKGLDALTQWLITQYGKFSLEAVSALTGFTPTEILDELRHHLSSYPERDWGEKYVHFTIAERAIKWHTEGEDRNRFYFWSASPLYAPAFFHYALSCPDEGRGNYGLYRELLLQLAPGSVEIEHAGMQAAATRPEFTTASRVAKLLAAHPAQRKKLREKLGMIRRYPSGSTILRYLELQLNNGEAIYEYLSADVLHHVVENYAEYSADELDHLFTITSIIQDLNTGKSVLLD